VRAFLCALWPKASQTTLSSTASTPRLSLSSHYKGLTLSKVAPCEGDRCQCALHLCQGLGSRDQLCELHHFMHMYNYFLKARVSLRTLSSPVINLFTQVAIVLELALVSSQFSLTDYNVTCRGRHLRPRFLISNIALRSENRTATRNTAQHMYSYHDSDH
jgi:hypothetical protein